MADVDWTDVPILVATTCLPFSSKIGTLSQPVTVGSDVVLLYDVEPYVAYTRALDPYPYIVADAPAVLTIHGQPLVEAGVIGSVVIPVTNTILVYFGAQFWG